MIADRRSAVAASTTVNGVDYARVGSGGERLTVFFINQQVNLAAVVSGATLTGGSIVSSVAVESIQPQDWQVGPPITLTLHVTPPDDPSTYTLRLTGSTPEPGGPALDPYFADTPVSFIAGAPTTVDCETQPPQTPAPATDVPPIDYLSKDFASFRNALLGFSCLRYPAWQERSEADFGVMFLESLCSVADDLSYQQDRVAAEAYLATATERRSIVRLARLIGYEPQPPLCATTTLQFTVTPGTLGIPSGLAVSAGSPDGTTIGFETGVGVADTTSYPANEQWNAMTPYIWDCANPILAASATEVWVRDPGGELVSSLQAALASTSAFSLLIDSASLDAAQPDFFQIVQVVSVQPDTDPLYGVSLAHIVWAPADALTQSCPLARTTIKGNVVPATQGIRHVESFAIESGPPGVSLAIVRTGPNQTTQYLYTLGQSELAWFPSSVDPTVPYVPEIRVSSVPSVDACQPDPVCWAWDSSLLLAEAFDAAFTIDPMSYVPLRVEIPGGASNDDYDGSAGWTVRFGDGTFGQIPATGSVFRVLYRAGGGAAGNVAAGAITTIDPASPLAGYATAVTNPFAATGGADAQTAQSVQQLAPQSYKNDQLTLTVAADFAAAAQELPWVRRSGSISRHTGSWLTTFTSIDPGGSQTLTTAQARALTSLLERRRLAGRQSIVLAPSYVALDLRVTVRARADAFRSAVQASVAEVLGTGTLSSGATGFFQQGNFTFGKALERSALEGAIQGAYGVVGVVAIHYRRAGSHTGYAELPARLNVGARGVIQVDNDPKRPLAGSVAITVRGGK